MSNNIVHKIISAVCILALLFCFTACGNTNNTADGTETATSDSAAPTLKDPDNMPEVTLSADIDWQSLYYERLRSLDSKEYPRCALIYLNNDEVPELVLDTDDEKHDDMLTYITENGLFTISEDLMAAEQTDFSYIEKTGRFLLSNKDSQTINNVADKTTGKATTQRSRYAWICYFNGELQDITYYLTEDRLGEGDPYTKISDLTQNPSVSIKADLPTAIKDYYDVDQAKTPEFMSVDGMIDSLKGDRKAPDRKAGDYSGDVHSLVSTYKDVSGKVVISNKEKTLHYRIPQIDLEGEEIEAINKEILELFNEGVAMIENPDRKATDHPGYQTADYSVYGQNGVLSLVISTIGFGSSDSPDQHFIYNIDVAAKKKIGNLCLLNSYGVDPQLIETAFTEQVGQFFTKDQFPAGTSEDVIDGLYRETVEMFSPVDVFNLIYFDDAGNPTVLYRQKQLAGEPYVEKALTLYP